MGKSQTYASVLKHKGFLNLWLNQILVQLAYNSLNFALIIWVFRLFDSNIAVSTLVIAIYLPAVIFGLFAGVCIDIMDRRKIIISIDFLLVLLFLALIPFKFTLLPILIIAFLINTLAVFYMPTESSTIPLIVKPEQLYIANSLFSMTQFTMFLLGFGLSGPLLSLFGIDFIFASGAVVLMFATFMAFFLPRISCKPDKDSVKLLKAWQRSNLYKFKEIALSQIKTTFSQIRGKLSVLFSIAILSGVQGVIAIMAVLIPSFMERVLNINATDGSYILIIPLSLGMIIGALAVGKLGYYFSKRRVVTLGVLIAGLLFFSVGAAPLVSPAIKYLPKPQPLPFIYQPSLSTILIFGSFLLGITMVSVIIPSQTVLQQTTKEAERGKVFAVLAAFMSAVALIPTIIVGLLADYFGSMPIFIGVGGTVALLGLFGLKPDFFFEERQLPLKLRQFVGLGHWRKAKLTLRRFSRRQAA